VPWIVWLETSVASNFVQLFVARGVKDAATIGGFHWTFVGAIGADKEPTINVDPKRAAVLPSGVFAETGDAVLWVVWTEIGAGRPGRIFTARGVADANTPGGFKWINVPPCTPNRAACALNVNPLKDAADASMAAGSLKAGEASGPWIAWDEVAPTGKEQILLSRLDTNTLNSILNVGGSLNVDQNHDATLPSIRFVSNIPYVTWLEDDGSDHFTTQLRHLASDPQTGT
jgi:hypothetical protein